MCLIAYSSNGERMAREIFDTARAVNPDGIGVFSARGVHKYIGKRAHRKAWRALGRLERAGIPHGVHFRWRTHGAVSLALVHPFLTPDGRAYVAHNGVIALTAPHATETESDTSLYVARHMRDAPAPSEAAHAAYFARVTDQIGGGNKLLVMDAGSGAFTLCNESAGFWYGSHWFSNDYSVPESIIPAYDWTAKRAVYDWQDATYLDTRDALDHDAFLAALAAYH